MPHFSEISARRLETCCTPLQNLFNEVVKTSDCIIICGNRGSTAQNLAYNSGHSKVRYPNSKHNPYPSNAVDVAPYFKHKPHIRWDNSDAFYFFAGYVFRVAETMSIPIRWGGNWNGGEIERQNFNDLCHYELLDI